jgi:hypothetical protein
MTSIPWVDAVIRGHIPPWANVNADPQTVLKVCAELEISGLVHGQLTRSAVSSDWPDALCLALEQRVRAAAAIELVRAREITCVLDALATRGVFPVLLKGAALARTVYDGPAMRPSVDTDLLVSRDQVEITRDVMTRLGYREPPMTGGEHVFCQFQLSKIDPLGVEHVFDVHWKISTQTLFADVLTYAELSAEAVPIPALGSHARTGCGPHALLLACIHPVMHHGNEQRLLWMCDIHLLVRRLSHSELLRFARLAVDKQMAAICRRELSLAAKHCNTPLRSDVLEILSSSTMSEPASVYLRPRRRWHHELLWNIRALPQWRPRMRLLREVLLPSPRYMLDAYHLGSRSIVLLPALYAHRCAYGAFKIIAGKK